MCDLSTLTVVSLLQNFICPLSVGSLLILLAKKVNLFRPNKKHAIRIMSSSNNSFWWFNDGKFLIITPPMLNSNQTIVSLDSIAEVIIRGKKLIIINKHGQNQSIKFSDDTKHKSLKEHKEIIESWVEESKYA